MLRVIVGELIDGVSHSVLRRRHKQGIVGVEYLSRHYQVPFSEQTACILTFLAYEGEKEIRNCYKQNNALEENCDITQK